MFLYLWVAAALGWGTAVVVWKFNGSTRPKPRLEIDPEPSSVPLLDDDGFT